MWSSYLTLKNLLRDLGATEAEWKAVPPTHALEFLGVWFDLINMTILVTEQRMQELLWELEMWRDRKVYSRKQLESLLGKLQFVSNCVRPGRLLVFRLHNELRQPQQSWRTVTGEMRKDINWWRKFLPVYDQVSIMWMDQQVSPDALLATDSCLTGIGGFSQGQFFHAVIPEHVTNNETYCIAHLELLAIIIALKVWGGKFKGIRFTLHCDNSAVVEVINHGTASDEGLQELLRQLAFQCAVGQFEVVAVHLKGNLNRIPDWLSRWHLGKQYKEQFDEVKQPYWQEV